MISCFYSLIFTSLPVFKAIFLSQKSTESLQKKFIEEYKMGDKLLLIPYFDNFDFQCTLFSKNEPKFWCPIPNQTKSLKYFYGRLWAFGLTFSPLNSTTIIYSSEVTLKQNVDNYYVVDANVIPGKVQFEIIKHLLNSILFLTYPKKNLNEHS